LLELLDVPACHLDDSGQANFDLAQRGYSRDQSRNCKQACIELVISRCEMPGDTKSSRGNMADLKTVKHIVNAMGSCYGTSDRVRDIASEADLSRLGIPA